MVYDNHNTTHSNFIQHEYSLLNFLWANYTVYCGIIFFFLIHLKLLQLLVLVLVFKKLLIISFFLHPTIIHHLEWKIKVSAASASHAGYLPLRNSKTLFNFFGFFFGFILGFLLFLFNFLCIHKSNAYSLWQLNQDEELKFCTKYLKRERAGALLI